MRTTQLVATMLAAVGLVACAAPTPTHALVVRHPEGKCALIAFSGCSAFVEPEQQAQSDDAGAEAAP